MIRYRDPLWFLIWFVATSYITIHSHICDKCLFNSAPSAQFTFHFLLPIFPVYFSPLFFFLARCSSELGISGLMRGQKVRVLVLLRLATGGHGWVSHNTFLLKLINPDCAGRAAILEPVPWFIASNRIRD